MAQKCPGCGNVGELIDKKCGKCGATLRGEISTCPNCGKKTMAGWKKCPYCLTSLDGEGLKDYQSSTPAANYAGANMQGKPVDPKSLPPPPPPPAPKKYVITAAEIPYRATIAPTPTFFTGEQTLHDIVKGHVADKGEFAIETEKGTYRGKTLLGKIEDVEELQEGGQVNILYVIDEMPYKTDTKGNVISILTKDAEYKKAVDTGELSKRLIKEDKFTVLGKDIGDYKTAAALFEKAQKDLYDRTGIVVKKEESAEKEEDLDARAGAVTPRKPTATREGSWVERDRQGIMLPEPEKKGYLARLISWGKESVGKKPSPELSEPEEEGEEEKPAKGKGYLARLRDWANEPVGGKKPEPKESPWRISPKPKAVPPPEPEPDAPESNQESGEGEESGSQKAPEETAYECPACGNADVKESDTKCNKCGAKFE